MRFDLAIIGGGTAGALLAARLSEDPTARVVLIEAGGEPSDPDILNPQMWPAIQHRNYDWDYRITPQPGKDRRAGPHAMQQHQRRAGHLVIAAPAAPC